MALKILNPGLLTTIQDLGRPGYFHLGIPIGGAMDRLSLRTANLLVGNPEDAACLESVFQGPKIEFTEDAIVAVTGAELPPRVDGEEIAPWEAFEVKKGQTLTFDYLKKGARAYIAISGGIDTEPALGSRSTYPIGSLGGYKGRAVQEGDELPIGSGGGGKAGRRIGEKYWRMPSENGELRVLTGLYWHRLTPESQKNFFDDDWKVASEADRMGYRFQGGREMEFVEREQPFGAGSDPSNIVDGCYPYGSIQVPGGLEPIVLHRDAVSGGGYFMLGAVISADMDLIGQMQPNQPVKFVEVDMDQALSARADRSRLMQEIREALA